jgi:nucleoside-diphosphate-sugar epimerase
MKIFVTGSSGFIGKNLIPELQNRGNDVHEMSADLLDFKAVKAELRAYSPDVIVHLAARTEVEASFYDQTGFSSVNYVGTVNLIESACELETMPYFCFASTMEVYGWQPISDRIELGGRPGIFDSFDENTPCNPNAPYAVAKLACEKYLAYAGRTRGLEYAMLRQTNAYGRQENNFFVTEQFIYQMLTNKDNVYFGYDKPYRNFIHRQDVVSAWVHLIYCRAACSGQVFTIGPNYHIQIREHAENIAREIGWEGTIHWNTRPQRPGEIYYLCSKHDKFTMATGWIPRVAYEDGIKETIEIWRNKLNE